MTQEQKEQLAREGVIIATDTKRVTQEDLYRIILWALNARDEEFALLKAEIENDNAVMKQLRAELAKAQNPWIKTEDKLPPSPKGYYHEWVLVKMDKRDDTPFTAFYKRAIDKWFTDGEFGYKEIARPDVWMPIPEGGNV